MRKQRVTVQERKKCKRRDKMKKQESGAVTEEKTACEIEGI